MTEPVRKPTEDDYTWARVIVNMLAASAHDSRREISMKTGIEPKRLDEILLHGTDYPDLYEIAAFEQAYRRRIWPGRSTLT